jgi:hypothetical protein
MDRSLSRAVDKALTALSRPGVRLIRQNGGRDAGYYVAISGKSFRVPDEAALKLLERNDIQPHDSGLLAGFPQSWTMVRRRP